MQPKEYDCKYAYAVKFHERVSRHLLGETIPLKAEVFHSVEPVPFQLAAAGKYRPISEGENWGGAWESGWFRLHAEIPADWTGRQLALRLNLGGEALLFDRDGVPQFAFSAGSLLGPDFRKEIYRLPDCPAGRQAEFLVEAAELLEKIEDYVARKRYADLRDLLLPLEAADIALINDKISELPHLLLLAKRMMLTIKCNLTFSMTLNFIAIILAVTGVLNPVVGALVHNAGSVIVIVNSAFLLGWKQKSRS